MTGHDDWNELAQVWTAPQDGPDLTADLVAGIRRRALLARINFHIEAWGAVVAGLAGAWFAFAWREPVMGGAAFLFSAFALAATLWARRGAEPGLAATPREALLAAIAQARSGLRWARAGEAITAASLLFVVVVGLEAGAFPGGAWIWLAILIALIGCVVLYERHARRAKARIAGHEAAMRELDEAA